MNGVSCVSARQSELDSGSKSNVTFPKCNDVNFYGLFLAIEVFHGCHWNIGWMGTLSLSSFFAIKSEQFCGFTPRIVHSVLDPKILEAGHIFKPFLRKCGECKLAGFGGEILLTGNTEI
ncbi:hypothetical protein WISP_59917 [Willisornis vidua]|uniref:Uncharacterized protein n=1 Tax=Willisornis vidua TaxID=1566151 RepID=A0ABQ9DGK8_9PASS|nr:hypothetical protein WISP_59917 [Willisornis vidua]